MTQENGKKNFDTNSKSSKVLKVRASLAQMVTKLPTMRETQVHPWVKKIPWRRGWQPTPIFLPGEFHGQRSLADYSPWGCKESDMIEQISRKVNNWSGFFFCFFFFLGLAFVCLFVF